MRKELDFLGANDSRSEAFKSQLLVQLYEIDEDSERNNTSHVTEGVRLSSMGMSQS